MTNDPYRLCSVISQYQNLLKIVPKASNSVWCPKDVCISPQKGWSDYKPARTPNNFT